MTCLVQAGRIPAKAEQVIKSEMICSVRRILDTQVEIDWIEIPQGSGFTAARPSEAIIASLTANRTLNDAQRNALLKDLSQLFVKHTRQAANSIVAYVRDPIE